MTTLEQFIELAVVNAATAFVLAVIAAAVARRIRWSAAVHALWLVVLLRLIVPPVVGVPILPPADAPEQHALVSLDAASARLATVDGKTLPSLPQIGGAVWIIGAMAIAGIGGLRSRRLRRALQVCAPADPALRRRVEELADRLGVRPPRTLLVTGRVPPMLWGRLSGAVLLLPDELLERLSPPQIEALIAHELAHLKRRDHWVRWLELTVTVTWWFNPVTWWARRRLRQAEERCCDAVVARTLPDHARAYADTLVETLRFLAGTRITHPVGAVAMADLSEVQRRLEMILSTARVRNPSPAAYLALATLLVAALTVTPMLSAGAPDRELPAAFDEPITLSLNEAKLADVLRTFATLTQVQMVVEPAVTGSVTVELRDVPAWEALDRVTMMNNAAWRFEDGTVTVYSLDPAEPSPMLVGHLGDTPVYKVDGDITDPKKISAPPPQYPEDCRAERVMGLVVLDTVIDATGTVVDVSVERSPDNRLSEAAMDAIRSWVFEPATLEGKPVAVRYVLTVNFRLE